jgi:PAS domain S-box-containing protein
MSVAEPNVQSILLGDAIDHAPAAVLVADDDGRYVAVNTYACQMLGYTRSEFLALKVTDVARYPGASAEFAELLSARRLDGTTRLRHKDGTDVDFVYRAGETTIAGMTYYVAVGWPAE